MKLRSIGRPSWFDAVAGEPEWWHRQAACAETDPDAFFPDRGGSAHEAKRVCSSCDVAEQCLNYALDHDQNFGVWGGMTPPERHRLARRDTLLRRTPPRTPPTLKAPPK